MSNLKYTKMGQKNFYHNNNQYGGRQFEAPQVNETCANAAQKFGESLSNYVKQNKGKSALIAFGGITAVGLGCYGLSKAYKYVVTHAFKKKAPTAPAETPAKPAEAPAESAAEEGKK